VDRAIAAAMKHYTVGAVMCVVACAAGARADLKENLDWCIASRTADLGMIDCPEQYVKTYPECVMGGGRACLMENAVRSAKANDCANAFRLALICQCHNDGARKEFVSAGAQAVCAYLKTR
jgi:predicted Rossmann-fold nucleotide-binding protein